MAVNEATLSDGGIYGERTGVFGEPPARLEAESPGSISLITRDNCAGSITC